MHVWKIVLLVSPWGMLLHSYYYLWDYLQGDVVINMPLGSMRGSYMFTRGNRKIYAFRGVPYAEPPVGDLRFEPPIPVKRWLNLLNANSETVGCLHRDHLTENFVGSENCLFLNIYTPNINSKYDTVQGSGAFPEKSPGRDVGNSSLPVIFYIHGGAFTVGSSSSYVYNPRFLLDQNIVLVTINYRLGVFGFISTEDEVSPGNNGLRDIILALQWVNQYISYFGGDPRRVTLSGQSAGGTCVHLLMISPLSQGLFSGSISHSGSVMSRSLSFAKRIRSRTSLLSRRVHCPTNSSQDMIRCLKKQLYSKLLENFEQYEWAQFPYPFTPRVDREAVLPVIPENPSDLILKFKLSKVPWLTGLTKNEGFLWTSTRQREFAALLKSGTDREISTFCSVVLALSYKLQVKKCVQLKDHYFMAPSNRSGLQIIEDFFGDAFMNSPLKYSQIVHSRVSPTYAYVLSYQGPYSVGNILGDQLGYKGVGHGDDLFYFFGPNYIFAPKMSNSEPYKYVKYLTEVWAHFAAYGYPPTPWPEFEPINQFYMNVGDRLEVRKKFRKNAFMHWKDVYQWTPV